jgi:hypothetical protein
MAWYRQNRDDQVADYRAKQRQKVLLTGAGVLGLAGGLARAPWAAKHAVRAAQRAGPRVGVRVPQVSPRTRTRLADIERTATETSMPLAIASGALGSLSSLTYANRLKRETKTEGEKLGLVKNHVEPDQPPRDRQRLVAARERANDDLWRQYVSADARNAHDEVLPTYSRRYGRQALAGTGVGVAGGVTGLAAGRAAVRARRAGAGTGKVGALSALAALGAGSTLAGGVATSRALRRGAEIEASRRAIRARGYQRALDAVG